MVYFIAMTLEEKEIFMCLAALLCEQFLPISIKSFFMVIIFFSVHYAAVKCEAKVFPFGVNCRLQLAGLGRKRGTCEANVLSLQLRYHRQIIRSILRPFTC